MMTTPNRQVVITCSADTAVVCPGLSNYPAREGHLLLPLQALRDLRAAVAGDERHAAEAQGHAAGLRLERQADRDAAVQRQGQQELPPHHARRGDSRSGARLGAALRDRARQRDPVVPADRLHAVPGRHRPDGRRRADHRARVARRGEEPRARAPDRCAARQVRDGRALRRLGHARPGLAAPGAQRRARRPAARRDLPAPDLPLPRRRRGARARHLLGIDVRRDPAPRRHADPAGLRRPDPDDRRRGRREHRHIRTHQGGVSVRSVREGGDLRGLREGLPHDPRRERRHLHHRPRAVRGRDCRA